MVRPTVTGEIIRRNGGKLPKDLAPKRTLEGNDSDQDNISDNVSTVTDASTSTKASAVSTASSLSTGRRPFSVEDAPEDIFDTKIDIYGATRIPKNDVLYVANYMEYIATEAALEQPVGVINVFNIKITQN